MVYEAVPTGSPLRVDGWRRSVGSVQAARVRLFSQIKLSQEIREFRDLSVKHVTSGSSFLDHGSIFLRVLTDKVTERFTSHNPSACSRLAAIMA
jgi:hypothetical protein